MQLDGWIAFALVILAAMAIMIYEFGRGRGGALTPEETAEDGFSAAEIHAGLGDFTTARLEFAPMPWDLPQPNGRLLNGQQRFP